MSQSGPRIELTAQMAVTKHLIECIQIVIDIRTESRIEQTLQMITNHLTYDDPGMFSKSINISTEKSQIQDTTVLWLINQVIYLSINPQYKRLEKVIVDLQKKILSASLLKQPSLFRRIFEKYVDLLETMSKYDKTFKQSLKLNQFREINYDITSISPGCTYKNIEIENLNVLNHLIKIVLRVLSYTTAESAIFFDDIYNRCNRIIIDIFLSSHLTIKLYCLRYFTKTSYRDKKCDVKFQEYLSVLIEGIADIESRLRLWIDYGNVRSEEIAKYIQAACELIERGISMKCIQQNEYIPSMITSAFHIVSTHNKLKVPGYDEIARSAFKLLKSALSSLNNCNHTVEINQLIFDSKNHIEYFTQSICLLLFADINESVTTWTFIDKQMQQLTKHDNSINIIVQNINCLSSILLCVKNIENKIKICEQKEKCQTIDEQNDVIIIELEKIPVESNKLNGKKYFFSNYEEILKNMLNLFNFILREKNINIDRKTLFIISELSMLALSISDAKDIDEYVQLQIMLFALCSHIQFSELLYDHFQQAFDSSATKIKQLFNSHVTQQRESIDLKLNALKLLRNIDAEYLTSKNREMLMDFLMQIVPNMNDSHYRNILLEIAINAVIQDAFNLENFKCLVRSSTFTEETQLALSAYLKRILCLLHGNCIVLRIIKCNRIHYEIVCKHCNQRNRNENGKFYLELIEQFNGKYVRLPRTAIEFDEEFCLQIFKLFLSSDQSVRNNMIECIPTLLAHLDRYCFHKQYVDLWLRPVIDDQSMNRIAMSKQIGFVQKVLRNSELVSKEQSNEVVQQCLQKLLKCVKQSFVTGQDHDQSLTVDLIHSFAMCHEATENTIRHCLRMHLYFCIYSTSQVLQKALQSAIEICRFHRIDANKFLIRNRTNFFKVIVPLCISNYLNFDVSLEKSLYATSYLFGYSNDESMFIKENYDMFVAMIIPIILNQQKCFDLLEQICLIIRKDLPTMIQKSFLTIYIYLHLHETPDVIKNCLDFTVEQTGYTIKKLLKVDHKLTTFEILIYYHLNPKFVINTFQILLCEPTSRNEFSLKNLAEHLASKFLGVICHFEQILKIDKEQCLKEYVLQSLGEIMRFMGSEHITQLRFKLLAVLRTALTIDQSSLKAVCAKVWKIFISTVDLMSLGPLLSTIFVSLEPLFETHANEVNEMLKYLIIKNGSLLSVYIPDLFFIKETKACDEIKQYVSKYTERSSLEFMEQFKTLMSKVNHDNLTVRVYGLNYLTKLFEENRIYLNELIIGQQQINSLIENLLESFMVGIKNNDRMLQTATARCLGKLGAIDPSYFPSKEGPQRTKFVRSIDTNEFAILALAELCIAYQFQKTTKNVDGYSLAIQEILLAREVCPKTSKNMEVWEAIPERMRPLMEPLLTSCYALTYGRCKRLDIHPIFGSHRCQSYEDWAMNWAIKIIETINDERIKNLFRSFKPSMRSDIHMMSFFLPYVILHAIYDSNDDDRREIAEEILTVANAVLNPANQNNTTDNMRNFNQSIADIDFTLAKKDSDVEQKDKNTDVDISIKCAKLAFHQLDFIDRWLRHSTPGDLNYNLVKKFTEQINKKVIAATNFACSEYARALMYCEAYIEEDRKGRFQNELPFLFQIHAELMDPDSLEGVLNLKNGEPTLPEQIMKNNVQGRLHDSVVCYERMMDVDSLTVNNCVEMIQCYLGLDLPETAILLADGLMKQLFDQNEALLQNSAEALWRLSRFDELQDLIKNSNFQESNEWGIRCGQILLDFRKDDDELFADEIDKSRLAIFKNLRIVGDEQNPYQKGYSHLMKLHMISEIEQARETMNKIIKSDSSQMCIEILENFFKDWEVRLHLLQPTARNVEPVLCLRRIVMNEAREILVSRMTNSNTLEKLKNIINTYIGDCWMKSSELARESEMYQQADLYIFNAETYRPRALFIEKAKLLWKKGNHSACFKVLERGIEEIMPSTKSKMLTKAEKIALGEAKFLVANYNAASLNINTELNMQYFKSANNALPESEKCLVHYAQFIDKTLAAILKDEIKYNPKTYEYQAEIMYIYCKSMLYGSNYIYQSMPRVLSIWFDFTATEVDKSNRAQYEHFHKICRTMNKAIEQFSEKLPAFVFFTAFSQLVSRICHPSQEVYNILKTVLIKLIIAFPQQSLWMILSVFKSSLTSRVRRCTEIFSDKRLQAKSVQKLIQDFNSLAEKMIDLTNKELQAKISKFSVRTVYPELPDILSRKDFSRILLPIEKYMQPVLPSLHQRDKPATTFNAFPNEAVHITGIRDELIVLASMQRPRRVTLRGSDGKDYIIMMKPKDDLRKDFRLMEFNSVVKKYLHQNADARQRRLNIRTYAVIPLNEECGIIEWVNNLHTFRSIITGYYKQKSLGAKTHEIREGQAIARESFEKRKEWFLRILQKHPPVFSDWFRERFTSPHNWYQARNAYVRTTAVMSTVGYILGLGDRHGENLLFDSCTGDTVHVDFNCLFNKGETFEYPELVPFRLTHNMVHAMGPLGVDGPFKKCCEITLRVLQEQMPTLMSVLRPFVYDPLVSWTRMSKSDTRGERTDAQAMANVEHIEKRLKGYVKIDKTISNMPLSTEGVISHCIAEATSIDLLAVMYIGWAPYL